jgi:hypothetical protein
MTDITDDSAQAKATVRGVSITDLGKLRVGVLFALKQEDGWTETITLDVVLPDEGQTLTEIKAAAIARGRVVLSQILDRLPTP